MVFLAEISGVKIFIKPLETDFSSKDKENSRYNFLIPVQNSRLQHLPIYILKIVLIFLTTWSTQTVAFI